MEKKLYRSKSDKKIAGVCGGLAVYLGLDITVVRLLCVLACLFTGIGLVAYIVAAVIIPEEPNVIETTATVVEEPANEE